MSRTRHKPNWQPVPPEDRSPNATGPRDGVRGQFSEGPRHRAAARRRGKKADRRRARHAAATSLRTGVPRPPRFGFFRPQGGDMPRQLKAPVLDADELPARRQ